MLSRLANLQGLVRRFIPRRTYPLPIFGTNIEVDGMLLRIDEEMARPPSLAEQLALRFFGVRFFRTVDLLPDAGVIRSARVSTGSDLDAVNERAAGMVRKLYRDRHITPFEGGVVMRLRVETPICFAQSFFQSGGSFNEESGRYTDKVADRFLNHELLYRGNRCEQDILVIFRSAMRNCRAAYESLRKTFGVANEQARLALPNCFITSFYWTISLRHLLELLALQPHKNTIPDFWVMRDLGLAPIVRDWCPWTHDGYTENPLAIPTHWSHAADTNTVVRDAIERLQMNNYGSASVGPDEEQRVGSVYLAEAHHDENIEDLMRTGCYTGPNPANGLAHSMMTFLFNYPIFVHRQMVRHRDRAWTEFPVDFDRVVSSRDFYVPWQFRTQVGRPMQYKFEDLPSSHNKGAQHTLNTLIDQNCRLYDQLRNYGVLPHHAATVLPYTYRMWAMFSTPIKGLCNFFSLRCDPHAQLETRLFAEAMYPWFASLYPWANEIFVRHLNFGKSPLFRAAS